MRVVVRRRQRAHRRARRGDSALSTPLRRHGVMNEATSPRRHITCTHLYCGDAARRRPLAVQLPPHRLHARSKLLGPPRFGRGAASRVAKTSPPQIRKLMCVLTRRMPPAAARTTLLDPPQITPISIRQSNGRGECGNRRPRRGNTRQYAMNCNSGDILLRRPGDKPLLRRRMDMQQYLLSRSVSAPLGANKPRRGCGSTPFIALQSTLDRRAGSPGAPALLRVRLIFANFIPQKVIELQFG